MAHQRYFVNNDQMVEALRCESFQSPVRCTPVAAVHQAHPATPNPQVLELLREVATEDPVTGRVADTAARCPKEMPRAVAGPSIPRSDAPSPPHAGSGGDREPPPAKERMAAFVALYTLFEENPLLATMDAFRMIDAPSLYRFCTTQAKT